MLVGVLFTFFFHAVASKGRYRESDKRHRNPLNAWSTSSCRAVTDLDNGLEARFKVKGEGEHPPRIIICSCTRNTLSRPAITCLPWRIVFSPWKGVVRVPSIPQEKKKRSFGVEKWRLSLLIGSRPIGGCCGPLRDRGRNRSTDRASECDRDFEISRLGELLLIRWAERISKFLITNIDILKL